MLFIRFNLVLIFCLLCSFKTHASGILTNDKYDMEFRAWSAVYMPGRDYRLLKAQCWQESRFNPNAVSPANARGICQFVDGTWNDVSNETGFRGSPYDADLNIMFAAYYLSKKLREFQVIESMVERDKHAMAAYNAGGGNIRKARRLCGDPQTWEKTKQCLPKVTGKHYKETWGYIDSIYKFYWMLF